MNTSRMNVKNQTRVALALVIAPFVIGFVIHMLGGHSLTVSWNGPLWFPKRLAFEMYSAGVMEVAPFRWTGRT
jgi:hypothetical protein